MPDFKKMSINDLVELDLMDFNSMTKKEMRQVVGRLRDAGNKKLKRLEKAGISTPALRQVERSGGKFSTKGKSLNELRSEYMRVTRFISNKSSTVTGYKKIQEETARAFKEKGVDIKPDQLDKVLKEYEQLKEMDPSVAMKAMKYTVLAELSQMSDKWDPEEAILKMQEKMDELYEDYTRTEEDFDGVSEFFEE